MSKELAEKKTRALTSMVPRDLTQAMELANMMAKSNLVPKDMIGKPNDVLVAIGLGAEIGLSPFQAVQSIMVVNGRPTVWGDAALGLVRASGLLEEFGEAVSEKEASCTVKRVGDKKPVTYTFTMEDAKRAKLDGKQIWQQYPKRMLQMRARSFALRDQFTDVLKGLILREEADDYNAVETTAEEEIKMPESLNGGAEGNHHDSPASQDGPGHAQSDAGVPSQDNQGTGEQTAVEQPTQAQLAKLMAMARDAKVDEQKLDEVIQKTFGVASKKDLSQLQLNKLYDSLESKIRREKK